ncbi:MAG: SIS domain-containing protein [Alphaproteobacteria bacterium]|nr:SIS domain-containing protein [Alphaproteobacteria bacterium]
MLASALTGWNLVAPPRLLTEALEAPDRIAAQLAGNRAAIAEIVRRLKASPPRFVVSAARGSSAHAARYGKYLIETRLGLFTAAAAPAVATLYKAPLKLDGALFFSVSQSGRSPDLVVQAEAAKAAGALTLALVNDVDSPLARASDAVLPLMAGAETSIAATKSFLASLSALAQLVAAWSDDGKLTAALGRLPEALRQAASADWDPPLGRASSLFVVGRGLGFAIASEAALKLKEVLGLHAEAYSAAEVLHGPVALVEPGFPVLAFVQDDETRASMEETLAALAAKGGVIARVPTGASPLHPALDLILEAQVFYPWVARAAVERGLDPDRPRHLRKVTETL